MAIIGHVLTIDTTVLFYDQNGLSPTVEQWKKRLLDPVSSRPKKVEAPVRCGEQTWNGRAELPFTLRNAAGGVPPSFYTG